MHPLLIALIMFFAIFTQTVAGFGTALIAMPLLISALGVQAAAPLVAIVAIAAEVILLIRYRHAINLRTVGSLSAASLIGIPLGVFVLQRADERFVLALLGVIITGYALYALLNLRLPEIKHPNWAYGFGFVGGVLSGAYNTGGPPVVIYGSCRRWSPQEFRSNLQGYFLLNSITTIISHTLAHHYTPFVWQTFLFAFPGAMLGLAFGISLDKYINPLLFRKIVMVLLFFLGLNLIF
jgi:uncharacterized protein